MSAALTTVPVSLEEANAVVARHHRHHPPVVGHKFSIGAAWRDEIIGVAIVGRPVSRVRDDGLTLEVTRLCTDGIPRPTGRTNGRGNPTFVNPCSFLYGAAARAALALGYKAIGTYTMQSEEGTSLRAANWRLVAETRGRSWSTPSRPRVDTHELGSRFLWEAPLHHD